MSLNWKEIALVLSELPLEGSTIQHVTQHDFHCLTWEMYHPAEGRWSLYSEIGTPNSRINRTTEDISAVQSMKTAKLQRFVQFARKHLEGAKVTAVSQAEGDRLIRLDLDNHGTPLRLYFRLYSGNQANIIVTDGDGLILDLLYRRPLRGETSGKPFEIAPPLPSVKEFTVRPRIPDMPFNRQIEEEYGKKSNEESLETLTAKVVLKRDRELKEIEGTVKNLARKAQENAGYENYKLCGDLLSCSLGSIPSHASSVTVDDYTTGRKKTITLDEKLTPSENVQAWYDRYQRAKGTYANSSEEYKKAVKLLEEKTTHYQEILAPSDDGKLAIRRLRKELSLLTVDKKEIVHSPGLTFKSGKFIILVGRNAKENDALLRHWVKSQDWWMHTRDYPGGYVFIKGMKGKSVPLDVLLDAGNLAVCYSKAKGQKNVDLYYTQVKYLRRAKDGPLGLVLPTQEKNFAVSVDESRLKRVLSTKEGSDADE